MKKDDIDKDYGKPHQYDPTFNGPIHDGKRSCTDVFWLILFIVFFSAWVGVGIYGMKKGNISEMLAPIDSSGKKCGVDSQLRDKKYLVFFDISECMSLSSITKCHTKQVCVNKCPEKTIGFTASQMNETTFPQLQPSMVCTYDVDVQALTYDEARQHVNNGKCAKYVIKSQPVFGQCFVNVAEAVKVKEIAESGRNATEVTAKVTGLMNFQQVPAQILQDLVQSRWYLLGALLAVVVVCFMYILLLRWVITPLVWASIAAIFGALGFALYFCYKKYTHYKDHPHTTITAYNDHRFWLMMVIFTAIVMFILFLVVIFLRSRITLAIALIKEGSKAVFAVKSTVFFPLFPWILQVGVIAYSVAVVMLLLSIGESNYRVVNLKHDADCVCTEYKDNGPCDPHAFAESCKSTDGSACQKATCLIINNSAVPYLHLVNVLGFFWTTFFISGVADMMLASTFATWYWTFKKRDLPFFTLTSGIVTTFKFHLGTVAFGSLIIAIIRIIRLIAAYIDQKSNYYKNPIITTILCFLKCCCKCLENLFKFISRNAYIMCAIHGKNFYTSAKDAFSLLMRNIVRVYVLDKVTDFIFFLSKITISIGAGFAMYYLLQWTHGDELHYNYVPAIIVSIATYLICTIFFNVYSMAVDTLFLCFLEDCERNDGSPEKPYFMSKNLMKVLGKKNKKSKNE